MDIRFYFGSPSPIPSKWTQAAEFGFGEGDTGIEYSDGSTTSVSIDYISGTISKINIGAGGSAGTGDAAWVPGAVTGNGREVEDYPDTSKYKVSGLSANTTYTLQFYGIASSGDRFLEISVNSASPVSLDIVGNTNRIAEVDFTTDSNGESTIDLGGNDGATGSAFIAALRVLGGSASPTVTTTDTLQPGEDFTLTAANYASAPVSPATLTDSAGSTITVPVTISGSGPYTAVGTMPTLAEAVTAGTSLLFGDVTIELTT